jgi:hypothetical protein
MMGLCHPWTQQLLATGMGSTSYNERGTSGTLMAVEMMRYFARQLELHHDECIIMTSNRKTYTTAVPHLEGQQSFHIMGPLMHLPQGRARLP